MRAQVQERFLVMPDGSVAGGKQIPAVGGSALALALADLVYRRFCGGYDGSRKGTASPVELADAEVASLRAAQQRLDDHRPTRALARDGAARESARTTISAHPVDAAKSECRKSLGTGGQPGKASACSRGCDTATGAKRGTRDSRERPATDFQGRQPACTAPVFSSAAGRAPSPRKTAPIGDSGTEAVRVIPGSQPAPRSTSAGPGTTHTDGRPGARPGPGCNPATTRQEAAPSTSLADGGYEVLP